MGFSTAPGQEPGGTHSLLAGLRVLLVDDEVDDITALQALLMSAGARVQIAMSVQEALDTFQGAPPDVLVSDLSMFGATGYSLIKRVRRFAKGHDVPAVVVSGLSWEEHRASAIEAGFDEWVSKTSAADSLVRVVARLAGRSAH